MNYNNLPNFMKESGLFCLWKYEQRGDSKPSKVPYQVNGIKAQPNNASTFTTFDTALNKVSRFDGLGIGIFNGISAIDIDHCVDEGGELSEMAQDIVTLFNGSYIEYSPSGTGLRIIFLASDYQYDKTKYYINNQSIGLEVYVSGATNKYVTVTGNVLNNGDIVDASNQLQILLDRYMLRPLNQNVNTGLSSQSYLPDVEVLEKAMNSKGAEKFTALWNGEIPQGKSHSDADMSLATL